MTDGYDRTIEYMRVSVTDRCDLRCKYCMPAEGVPKVDKSEILSSDEIVSVCRAAVKLGITKFKITGGEPLVRYDLGRLLAAMREIPGLEEITLTTNGQRLARYIDDIAAASVDGINISLDTLSPEKFADITRTGDILKTLEAIDISVSHGIRTKINCLVQKGFNETEIIELSEFAMDKGIDIRFVELMPIGYAGVDSYVSSDDILKRIKNAYPDLERDHSRHGNGPAEYYKVPDMDASIGIISSVHKSFCDSCNRVRLTSMGYIKPCLCYDDTVYIRPYIAEGTEALTEALRTAVLSKPRHHSFGDRDRVDHHAMSEIGG